MENWGF